MSEDREMYNAIRCRNAIDKYGLDSPELREIKNLYFLWWLSDDDDYKEEAWFAFENELTELGV